MKPRLAHVLAILLFFEIHIVALAILKSFTQTQRGQLPITGIAVTASPTDCTRRPGAGWEVGGPSPVASAVLRSGRPTWLCVQRNPTATSIVTGFGFLLEPRDRKHVSSIPQKVARTLPTLTLEEGENADEACQHFGPDFGTVEGSFEPAKDHRGNQRVHLCVALRRLSDTFGAEGNNATAILDLNSFRMDSGQRAECALAALGGDHCSQIFAVPGFDLELLMDDPPLLCIRRCQGSPDSREMFSPTGGRLSEPFPKIDLHVAKDSGNRTREHVFVVGPETSGTRLWTHLVASGLNLTDLPFEGFQYNGGSAVFHLSLPWGSTCGDSKLVPTYMDFGGTEGAYELLPDFAIRVQTSPLVGRFNVDVESIVARHRERGDRVRVVLAVRDPRASLWGKQALHCKDPALAVAEQSQAFALLVKAKQANLPEVTVVCFEEMVEMGRGYVDKAFTAMGLALADIPEISDENDKYGLHVDGSLCVPDMPAYAELCPNSPLTAKFKSMCGS